MSDDFGLRVLMVLDSLSVGGTETHVLSLAKALRAQGLNPGCTGASGEFYGEFARAGIPVHFIDLSAGSLMNPAVAKSRIASLRRLMEQRRIQLVHVHQTPSGLYAAQAARELGIPVVFTVHGTYYGFESLEEMSRICTRLISVSRNVQYFMDGGGIRSAFVPNGIDLNVYSPASSRRVRKELRIPEQAPVIVYASRLAWDKATVCSIVVLAAQALRESDMPDLHLVIVGGGSQSHAVSRLVEEVHLEAGRKFIHMTGPRTGIRDYYAAGDLVVGTGRVALEAMACGKPVLGVGNHGYFGLVEPSTFELAREYNFGDHGSLARPSVGLLAQTLRDLLGDQQLLGRVAEESRAWVAAEFDAGTIAARTREVYAAAIRDHSTFEESGDDYR
ncbi:glycosyltransferase family 4 protein [Cohnella sp. GCM10027633]|uniref:glycosyltransferase family 4 protein n=1 Tax=unclassified Cohnella TaxID=2636738 RepID=UPI003635E0B6